jgi:hypothetical protein
VLTKVSAVAVVAVVVVAVAAVVAVVAVVAVANDSWETELDRSTSVHPAKSSSAKNSGGRLIRPSYWVHPVL